MSKVYSFRLDSNNPRETQAREVIESWISQGYSIRFLVTESLISYANHENMNNDIYLLMDQLRNLIENIGNGRIFNTPNAMKDPLSPSFIDAIKSVRPQT